MNNRKKYIAMIFSIFLMMVLILDSKTAIAGATEGLSICLHTVIPSLFPFFYLSSIMNTYLTGHTVPFIKPLGKLCRIPEGSEGLLIVGALGGYPVGARSLQEAYLSGALTKKEAERMLGFCNNAGPAFLFGIGCNLFKTPYIPAVIYLILLVSSVVTGIILPGGSIRKCEMKNNTKNNSLKSSLYAIASVCGWVILFRVVITFLNRWVLWLLPDTYAIIVTGLLELTNGCIQLTKINNDGLRFILLSVFTGLGGYCVANQTATVAESLSCKYYYIGKLIQTGITFVLSLALFGIFFPGNRNILVVILPMLSILTAMIIYKQKNNAGNYCVHGV